MFCAPANTVVAGGGPGRAGHQSPRPVPKLEHVTVRGRFSRLSSDFGWRLTSTSLETLRLKEVLRRPGQQAHLQALCGRRSERDVVRTPREVLCAACLDNRTSRFAGTSWRIEPSDGLEPSTPSLPSRFREGLGITGNRLLASYSLHLRRFGRLSHPFLEPPLPTRESPEPVPRTCPHPDLWRPSLRSQ
jgi:hypothetical protein